MGTVTEHMSDGWSRVEWDNGGSNSYKNGQGGTMDLLEVKVKKLQHIRTGRTMHRLRRQSAASLQQARHLYGAKEPDCPTGLTATDSSQTSVVLRWTPPISQPTNPAPILGYRVLILPPKSDRDIYTDREPEPEPELVVDPELEPEAVAQSGLELSPQPSEPESAKDKEHRERIEAAKQELQDTDFRDRMYGHHLGGTEELERESFPCFGGTAQVFTDSHQRWKPAPPHADWYVVRTVQLEPGIGEFEVVDLLPRCEYSFRLQAFNRVGVSTISDSCSATTLQAIERISGPISFEFHNGSTDEFAPVYSTEREGQARVQGQLIRGAAVRTMHGETAVDLTAPGTEFRINEINGILDPLQSDTGFTFETQIFVSPFAKASAAQDESFEEFNDSRLMGIVAEELFEHSEFGEFLANVFEGSDHRRLKCDKEHPLTRWFAPSADSNSTCNLCNVDFSRAPHQQRLMMRCQQCNFIACVQCQGHLTSFRDVG